ncbi:MAG: PIN domain-containing protein [Anaerolineae bacterium]|nr:PIN domain-containing protein [Anaerolineae bacterium]
MLILLDTNILLDVLLDRQPWAIEAATIWQANEEGRIVGHLVASTLTDIFYIAHRLANLETARKAVHLCLETFEICPVDRKTLQQAYALPGNDFEDNLQIACAHMANLNAIVSRDSTGFKAATIPVLTPTELLAQLE